MSFQSCTKWKHRCLKRNVYIHLSLNLLEYSKLDWITIFIENNSTFIFVASGQIKLRPIHARQTFFYLWNEKKRIYYSGEGGFKYLGKSFY